jgi:hypothetical protein
MIKIKPNNYKNNLNGDMFAIKKIEIIKTKFKS